MDEDRRRQIEEEERYRAEVRAKLEREKDGSPVRAFSDTSSSPTSLPPRDDPAPPEKPEKRRGGCLRNIGIGLLILIGLAFVGSLLPDSNTANNNFDSTAAFAASGGLASGGTVATQEPVTPSNTETASDAQSGTITFTSDPPGAILEAGNEFYGPTPQEVSLPPGEHGYYLYFDESDTQADLYKPYSGIVNVDGDDAISVFLDRNNEQEIAAARAQREAREAEEQAALCASEADTYPLVIEAWSWSIQSNYAIVEGQVTNQSPQTLENVEAVTEFSTDDGTFITSDSALLDYTTLLPDQSSPFTVYATYNPAMSSANLTFRAFWGDQILAINREDSCGS